MDSRKLDSQCNDGQYNVSSHILLEMHQTFGEHEHVSLLKRFVEQTVVSGDEAD
jgi:hypothetical protein